MIEVAHLSRRYGQLLAVDDVSFEVERGEVVGLLGPNGAGKTTVMRMLTGFLPATRATALRVAGHDVLRESLEVRQRIGYLPESVPLYGEMRVEEMLRFQGKLHSLSGPKLRHRMAEVMERVGVLDRRRQLVSQLSRGLRQRVGLAVALLPDPEVLILDEPTSGLDPLQRREVRDLIRELAEEHTVLVSSHILAEVESICPRVLILNRGRLVADGTYGELLHELAGPGAVRLEAVVGPDADAARRKLASLDGVRQVRLLDKQGIHQAFAVEGEGDLREDVGALAHVEGWALRELSFARPSLEELFARLVLGEAAGIEATRAEPAAGARPASGAAAAPAAPTAEPAAGGSPLMQLSVSGPDEAGGSGPGSPSTPKPAGAPPALGEKPAAGRTIYSLNPFDRGASRDLSKPVTTEPDPPAPPADDAPGGSPESDEPAEGPRA